MQLWDALQRQKISEAFGEDCAGLDNLESPYSGSRDLHSTIDSIPFGDVPWQGFKVRYKGELPPNPPAWMTKEYEVWYRDPLQVLEAILGNPKFADHMDWASKKLYGSDGKRHYIDLMLGDWAWEQSVRALCLYLFVSLTS